ncbi:hypothetical protein AMTR_s00008p00267970 [Amborella trichopoda]|uniref:Uncharacterized protein n=1 Tax=Amborella trichopoda TaxID=13333 RepID=W1NJS7_AMBTC|nr:hypothetical protein AMTR_s00008p00267970 [Amborella trichopoda]
MSLRSKGAEEARKGKESDKHMLPTKGRLSRQQNSGANAKAAKALGSSIVPAKDKRNKILTALQMSFKTMQISSKLRYLKLSEKSRTGQQQSQKGERTFWSYQDMTPLTMAPATLPLALLFKLPKSAQRESGDEKNLMRVVLTPPLITFVSFGP